MKTIKFYDLPQQVTGLSFDGDKEDLRLHSDTNIYWGAHSEEDYNSIQERIENYAIKGNGWALYTWCDVSGYSYWMETMEEDNYVQITVSFENEDVLCSEIDNIKKAIEEAENEFSDLMTIF